MGFESSRCYPLVEWMEGKENYDVGGSGIEILDVEG